MLGRLGLRDDHAGESRLNVRGRHLAEPQQWQHHPTTGAAKTIHTVNANVDWVADPDSQRHPWTGAFRRETTHVMFTHVLSRSYPDPVTPGAYMGTLALVGGAVRELLATSPDGLLELSQMDRVFRGLADESSM